MPYFFPFFSTVQSPGCLPAVAASACMESMCAASDDASALSSRWLGVLRVSATGPGGNQIRGSLYDGMTPSPAPPASTTGPVPDWFCDRGRADGGGTLDGTVVGASTLRGGAVRVTDLLSPPLRPGRAGSGEGTAT